MLVMNQQHIAQVLHLILKHRKRLKVVQQQINVQQVVVEPIVVAVKHAKELANHGIQNIHVQRTMDHLHLVQLVQVQQQVQLQEITVLQLIVDVVQHKMEDVNHLVVHNIAQHTTHINVIAKHAIIVVAQ